MEASFSFRWLDVMLIMPVIVLVLASTVPLIIKVLTGNREPNSFATLCYGLAGIIASGGWLVAMSNTHRLAFDGALVFDGISTLIGAVIVLVTGMALVYSRENLSTNNRQFSEYVFLLLNSAAGMMLVAWSNDLIMFFVGVELMSLCLYVLIAISSEERVSKEAAFKYFILGSFASAILLYGIAMVFGTSGTTSLSVLTEQGPQLLATSRLFLVGLIFLILGICFKVSIFPLHAWTPDVYQGAPTPVTAFMATGVKVATFVLFLRVISTNIFSVEQSERLIEAMQWLAALTMIVGNVAAVMQSNLKRMLAYSSVAHSGYILMGLIVVAISGEDNLGASSVLFYLVAYSLMTIGAFGILSIFEKNEESSLRVEDLKGLAGRRPWLSMCLTIFLLSLAGIPPTVGFFGKFFIFSAAIRADLVWLVVWGVISSVISVYYYLQPIVYMYMRDDEGVEMASDRFLSLGLVSASAALVLLFGVFANPIYNLVVASLR